MIIVRRLICWTMLFVCFNFLLVAPMMPNLLSVVIAGIAFAIFYIGFNIRPIKNNSKNLRLHILNGGGELMLAAMVCFTLEALAYAYVLLKSLEIDGKILIFNGIVCIALLFLMLLNGIIRIFALSKQLGILPRLGLLFFWWIPVINVLLLKKFLSVSQREYVFTTQKFTRNADRQHEKLCKTKYPLLMVHGIFFRDWKAFNYWGRIPKELEENGASIYYGSHQSSASVQQCAGELRQCIIDLVKETGCEKVNIIAHSKGGLDSRYMISCMGMDEHVASLTTINTPHYGCNYVQKLLKLIPNKVITFVGKKYASIYTKLGDSNPDFFLGLKDLTDEECTRLNGIMPDAEGVYYQSVASHMRPWSSAMFPMNVGYGMIKLLGGGNNDGLVSTESMAWGNFLGVLSPSGKQGISHGDMIDLTRKDVEGFDVGEFYVDLVGTLKTKGF